MITSNVRLRFNPNNMLDGAFAYLQKKFNKENITEDIVKINASSTEQYLYCPVIMRNFSGNYWRSSNESGSWYEVDFLQNLFYLKNYFIRDHANDFFKQWQVLGSNDGIHFDVVDDVKDFPTQSYGMHNILFNCKYPKVRRIFRIVANGRRNLGDYKFVIHRLEFYGTFISKPFIKTCKIDARNRSFHSFIVLSLLAS